MATTTNYGWTTPDDTALVKDGAAAIRTLGSSVDTTTKNLNPETTLGDIAYRSSTANVKTRLAIGSTGQVLTVAAGVPSWATPATPSSGLNLITSGTFTTSGSVSINDCFSSTYDNYKIMWKISTASSDFDLLARLRVSGSDDTNDYISRGVWWDGSANPIGSESNRFLIGYVSSPTAGLEFGADISVFSPYLSQRTQFVSQFAATQRAGSIGGGNKTTTSFTGMTFYTSTGTMTGTYKIYGLAN